MLNRWNFLKTGFYEGINLDNMEISQLLRYFHVTEARFAILTDGVIYRFFSDLENQNVMDSRPFFEFNMLDFTEPQVQELKRFTKGAFNLAAAMDAARKMKYMDEIKGLFADEMKAPSNDFVAFVLKQLHYPRGKQTKAAFKSLVHQAFGQFVSNFVETRLRTALAQEEPAAVVEALPAEKDGRRSPTEMVKRWVREHDGTIVLRECAHAAVDAGLYPDPRQAYNAVYTVIRRIPEMVKIAEGEYAIRDVATGDAVPPVQDSGASGSRFTAPFISRMWHSDGTPFTDAEYRAAGVTPPTKEQQAEFAERDQSRGKTP